MKNPGYIVKTKDGRIGRTYHSKGIVNNKIPVYLGALSNMTLTPDGEGLSAEQHFSSRAILCNPRDLDVLGFID